MQCFVHFIDVSLLLTVRQESQFFFLIVTLLFPASSCKQTCSTTELSRLVGRTGWFYSGGGAHMSGDEIIIAQYLIRNVNYYFHVCVFTAVIWYMWCMSVCRYVWKVECILLLLQWWQHDLMGERMNSMPLFGHFGWHVTLRCAGNDVRWFSLCVDSLSMICELNAKKRLADVEWFSVDLI